MVLSPEAIRTRLLRLEQVVSRLQQLSPLGRPELREDFQAAWTAERGLPQAAEHVLDPALRERLRGLGGFRNILVHGYLALDSDRVADALERAPRDFSDFMTAIRDWLATIGP